MKRRKGKENSINPVVYVHYVAFDERSLTTSKRFERVWILRQRSTIR